MPKHNNRKWLSLLSLLMTAILIIGTFAACGDQGGSGEEPEPEPEPIIIMNPLTGDKDYTEEAMARRPVAVVVENHPEARPQWGSDDPERSPDIIVQGEVEGGITRMLWLWADYTKLPEVVGPIRSARPPFIRFSELFDSIFIHWGFSHSKGDYIGADKTFMYDGVDHIDRMWYDNNVPLYDRKNRDYVVNVEHTGIIYGDKVEDAIKDLGFRTQREEHTVLEFNDEPIAMSDETCGALNVVYSTSAEGWMDTSWTYDPADGKYHTYNLDNDVARDNVIVLLCNTEYVTNEKATYCKYVYSKGGTAIIASNGTVKRCKFSVSTGDWILKLYDEVEVIPEEGAEAAEGEATDKAKDAKDSEAAEGEAAEGEEGESTEPVIEQVTVKLNPGKSWIGLASSNNGGRVSIEPLPEPEEGEEGGEAGEAEGETEGE